MIKIKEKIINLTRNKLAKDVLWMLSSKIISIGMQTAYFIILARLLGKENYGSFIAVTAVANLVFPFIPGGSEHLMMKNISINRGNFNLYFGNGILLSLFNGVVAIALILLFSSVIFPANISWVAILAILLADLICLALLDLSSKSLLASDLVYKAAQLEIFGTFAKLLAALSLLVFFPRPSVVEWSYLYFLSSITVTVLTILTAVKMLGRPKPQLAKLATNLGEGFYFSISSSASNINANLDKYMLSKMVGVGATGIYASAYRFIDVGNIALLALFGSSYTRFFQHGASGISGSLAFGKRLVPLLSCYAIASLIGLIFIAPYLPVILGEDYREAVDALYWLCPLPAIAAFQNLSADILTGSGHQKSRSTIQVSSAIINLMLNFLLIPIFSWKGAAIATVISDSLRAIVLWLTVYLYYRREVK